MQHIYAIIINFDMNCKLYRMVAVMLYVMQCNLFKKILHYYYYYYDYFDRFKLILFFSIVVVIMMVYMVINQSIN